MSKKKSFKKGTVEVMHISSVEATLRSMPHYNTRQTFAGAHKTVKHKDRCARKAEVRRMIEKGGM